MPKKNTSREDLDGAIRRLPTMRGIAVAAEVKGRLSRVDAGGPAASLEAVWAWRSIHSYMELELRGESPDRKYVRALHRAWRAAYRWERERAQGV